MKPQTFKVVLVTAPNLRAARKLARAALQARLAACANLMPGIESHYWWKNKMEKGSELLVIFKTTAARVKLLEKLVINTHPYDTPEFIVLPVEYGNERYLTWLKSICMG